MQLTFVKKYISEFRSSGTVRVISGLAGGNILAMAVAFIGSLVQARYVSPGDLGYLRSFSIVTGYVLFLNLGLFESLHRLYPYYIGKGQKERALAHAEIGQSWNVAVSAIISGVFIILAISALLAGNWRAALGWLVQVVAVIWINYGGYLSATYRSGHDFKTVAKGTVVSSIANLLILPLFVIWPYITLVLRSSLGSAVNVIYLHFRRPLRIPWRFNWKEWYGLVKQGLPIFIASYGASSLWTTLEMTLILHYLGTPALGLWTMSAILFQAAKMIPDAVNAVYFPRVYETFGQTGNLKDLWRLARKPMLLNIASMLFMVLSSAVLLPIVIPILMPKYAAAVPIMVLMMIALPLICLKLPYSFLVAKGNLVQQNIVTYAGMGSFLLLAMATIRFNLGLAGVVEADLLGQSFYVLLTFFYLSRSRRSENIT